MEEIYRDVLFYEGIYQISNLGNVKSFKSGIGKLMKPNNDDRGYYSIELWSYGVRKKVKIHQLVAESFLNHKRCGYKLVVNHIDFNKTNNSVDNLEIVTNRENSNKKHIESSSQYIGVYWHKKTNKWISQIVINGKQKYLGCFSIESEASEAYQKELLNKC